LKKKFNVYNDFLKQIKGEVPDRVPVAIWNTRSSIGLPKSAKKLRDYYDNIDIKLEAQLQPLKLFDDTLIMPGVWPDYGVILEASAFGCKIVFSDKYPPHALHFMKEVTEVNKLNVINPKKDGLMPKALQEYKYMLKKIPLEYLKNIGYLDGCALTTGPLEVSAMILGYENFYLGFYEHPNLVKKLLEIVTEGICKWLKELRSISGELKLLTVIEHLPGQISREHFEEFAFPFIKQIFDEFKTPIKLYHNEDNITHVADYIGDLGANIFHFGSIGSLSITEFKNKVDKNIILMGNIAPLEVLLEGNTKDVEKACLQLIEEGKPNLLLSSGGGLAPGTPQENVRVMVNYARNTKI